MNDMSEVTGDARIVHVRDTTCFLFDMGPDLELVVKPHKSLLGWVKLTKFSINDALKGLPQGPYHDFPVIASATSVEDKRAVIMPFIPMLQSLLHEAVKH